MMDKILIPCPKCCATGHIKLTRELKRTLGALRRSDRPLKIDEMLDKEVTLTAVHNRLRKLQSLDLAKVVGKDGPNFLWEAVK